MTEMTATEALERAKDVSEHLGKTYGSLQQQLLNPLIEEAHDVVTSHSN